MDKFLLTVIFFITPIQSTYISLNYISLSNNKIYEESIKLNHITKRDVTFVNFEINEMMNQKEYNMIFNKCIYSGLVENYDVYSGMRKLNEIQFGFYLINH